ncbi:gliding motility-associated C-terminal domain-containing protein [Owenweeksia hongkongensis]|uniref:gliding motility-associated C-terminal domain-containing protein n=1 Tax=Owenweeksia hongkongensis TaxID=253245 RepID=UPI003A8EE55B
MKNAANILLTLMLLGFTGLRAQVVVDTICTTAGPSNLAVPFQAGVTYSWQITGGTILSKPDSNDILVDWNPTPGFFPISVTAIPLNGDCHDTTFAQIYIIAPVKASVAGPQEVCRGTEVILSTALTSGVIWQGGKKDKEIRFIAHQDTTVYLVADNYPCDPDTTFHFIKVVDPPQTSISSLEDTLQVGTILDLYYTGASGVVVDWYLDENKQGTGAYARYQFDEEGDHVVTQVVSDGTCTDTLYRYVYVKKIFKLFIPNAFTPDGDGINDVFLFKGVGIAKFQANVYNRWGEMVYSWDESSGSDGWDGTQNGKPVPTGVYTYKIVVEDVGGTQVDKRGSFNLLR